MRLGLQVIGCICNIAGYLERYFKYGSPCLLHFGKGLLGITTGSFGLESALFRDATYLIMSRLWSSVYCRLPYSTTSYIPRPDPQFTGPAMSCSCG